MIDTAVAPERVGQCALCDTENVSLKESHSIPKFVYTWIKDSANTPYLRGSDNVNIRLQDGPKEYLLCSCCEGRLSVIEKELAELLFRKIANYRQQASTVTITEAMRVAVLSIFWRALLTTKGRDSTRTQEDSVKFEVFLSSLKSQIRTNKCRTSIYFAPFHGVSPYYGLPSEMTYQLERGAGRQDIRFFDEPHRFFAAFQLPFMYFFIFSEGWHVDEIKKSTEFSVGDMMLGNVKEVPSVLLHYIHYVYDQFEESKRKMDQKNIDQINADVSKNSNITGSDKSKARSRL